MKELMNEWKKFLDKKIILEADQNYLENQVKELLGQGYQEVKEINLPNNVYTKSGGGYRIDLMSPDGKQSTGYSIITTSGIRGMHSGPIQIQNRTLGNPYGSEIYKILFKDVGFKQMTPVMTITTKTSQQIPQEVLSADAPDMNVQGGKGSFTINGKYYAVDLSDVLSNINGKLAFASAKAEDIQSAVPDIKPGSILVGFSTADGKTINAYYINKNGAPVVKAINM